MKVLTFDTTLRDGAQGEGVSLSVDDKLEIARKLDEFGVDYIEGGWPGSNPKDEEFFARAGELHLKHARLTAFSSTRLAKNPAREDRSLLALLRAETPAVAIFGKTWDLHVHRALGIGLEENLALISDTVRFLSDHGREVIFDAEHFFDGYAANPEYALLALAAAKNAGATALCLCDTNGGALPSRLKEVVAEVRRRFDGALGIHTHNDSDLAVANTLAAVEAGATLVQGCMNGYGERCGNANLASIIANLELKMGCATVGPEKLKNLSSVCSYIAEVANLPLRNDQPFVGDSAFAHKAGVHVSAVLKDSSTYEHAAPETVGNRRRVLVSDLSGRANIAYKLAQFDIGHNLSDAARRQLLERVKQLENEGYDLETADGTFELLVRDALHPDLSLFDVDSYHISMGKHADRALHSVATVSARAQGNSYTATASGHGPLNALYRSLRICLAKVYPAVKEVRLTDFKVRLLNARAGTAGKVRVLVRWSDQTGRWTTVGVSDNVVEASWRAVLDAIRLELMRRAEDRAAGAPLTSSAGTP
jgi:2-isopropylmalate synthase